MGAEFSRSGGSDSMRTIPRPNVPRKHSLGVAAKSDQGRLLDHRLRDRRRVRLRNLQHSGAEEII
jgi:hypothetical protein